MQAKILTNFFPSFTFGKVFYTYSLLIMVIFKSHVILFYISRWGFSPWQEFPPGDSLIIGKTQWWCAPRLYGVHWPNPRILSVYTLPYCNTRMIRGFSQSSFLVHTITGNEVEFSILNVKKSAVFPSLLSLTCFLITFILCFLILCNKICG